MITKDSQGGVGAIEHVCSYCGRRCSSLERVLDVILNKLSDFSAAAYLVVTPDDLLNILVNNSLGQNPINTGLSQQRHN
jgi:hypothetical protein